MRALATLFGLGFVVCLAAAAAWAELVTLAWDPNPPEPAVGYYTIYSRLEGEPYLGTLDVEPSVEPQASVDVEIPVGFCRFFVCTATSAVGWYESGYSNEVYKCNPADQDQEPPRAPEPIPPAVGRGDDGGGGGGGGCFIAAAGGE